MIAKMKGVKFKILIIFVVCQFQFTGSDIFKKIISNVLDEVDPHHVTLYADKTDMKNLTNYNLVLKHLIKRVPTTALDFTEPASFVDFNPGQLINWQRVKNKNFLFNPFVSSSLHIFVLTINQSNHLMVTIYLIRFIK